MTKIVLRQVITSKEAILRVGRDIVIKFGLQGLNIRDVAKQCGVSVGSIYNYFPTKSDLIIATIESVWRKRYAVEGRKTLTISVYAMAILRIALCLFPQNAWLSANPPLIWGIYRNIPFAILGIIVIVLFFKSAQEHKDGSFRFMWLTIVLSFAFYVPVVLWADVNPLIGMLMIPKTCAYVWTVWIGFSDMKKTIAIKKD